MCISSLGARTHRAFDDISNDNLLLDGEALLHAVRVKDHSIWRNRESGEPPHSLNPSDGLWPVPE
jgi:hypothetical protein